MPNNIFELSLLHKLNHFVIGTINNNNNNHITLRIDQLYQQISFLHINFLGLINESIKVSQR